MENLINKEFRDYKGYTIYEDGTVLNKYNRTIKPIIRSEHGNRPVVRITDETGKQRQLALSRVVYHAFNKEEFDIADQKIAIMQKDNNPMNCHIDNLYKVDRRETSRKGRIIIPVEDQKKIQGLLDRGLNYCDVADMYGVNPTAIHHYCNRYGISKPNLIW